MAREHSQAQGPGSGGRQGPAASRSSSADPGRGKLPPSEPAKLAAIATYRGDCRPSAPRRTALDLAQKGDFRNSPLLAERSGAERARSAEGVTSIDGSTLAADLGLTDATRLA
jgi:hypothetical protein